MAGETPRGEGEVPAGDTTRRDGGAAAVTRSRAGLIAAGVVGALVVVLVALQLILPKVAEDRLRDRLEDNGTVEEVDVGSFPALELLWGRADETTIRMRDGHAGPGRFADLLARTADTEKLTATVDGARILTLRLRRLELRKRGRNIVGTATISNADLQRALPGNFDVRPVASGDGALVFEGSASILGRRLRGQVVVAARNGRVLLAPNVLFGGFLSLTVFADPRIEVLDVSAKQRPGGFTLTARSRLRE